MRTTVTLDADVEIKLQQLMKARGLTFKQALNQTLRSGLAGGIRADVAFPVFDLGVPRADLTHAARLVATMEDEEIARKLAVGR